MDLLAWQRNIRPLLFPAAKSYAVLMQLRRLGYETGLLSSGTLAAPCVSVGNICWGGSGKTPMVAWLLAGAAEQGLRPVVLTRGYRARPPVLPYVVRTDSPAQEAGDEPLLLQQSCPEAAILVDPKRLRAGHWAARLDPDLFILDDGMQHLAVRREINLVLLRETDLEDQWNRVIPAGSWREPQSALQRASAFLIKCSGEASAEVLANAAERLKGYGKAIYTFSLRATRCIAVHSDSAAVPQTPYLIATGIADSLSVARTASALVKRAPETVLDFPDHHDFDQSDWETILRACKQYALTSIVCTPKDAVKLRKFNYTQLYALDTTLEFGPYANCTESFPVWWRQYLQNCRQKNLNRERDSNNRT